jgi:acetoin utilization protein AcuB
MVLDLGSARVRHLMTVSVPTITPKTTVATALRLLREHGLAALPVCGEDGLLGLVDEKALLRFTPSEATTLDVYELHDVLDRLTVARATVPAPTTIGPDAGLEEAATAMLRSTAEVIPVVDGERFLGLLTWPSLLAAVVGTSRPARLRDSQSGGSGAAGARVAADGRGGDGQASADAETR